MKHPNYKDYAVIGLTAFLVIAASITLFFLYFKFSNIVSFIRMLNGILAPFFVGVVIAYLLAPLYNLLTRSLRSLLSKVMKEKTAWSLSKLLSVLISLLTALVVIGGLFALVLPRFAESIMGVANNLSTYLNRLNMWIEGFFVDNPDIYQEVTNLLNTASNQIISWTSTDLIPTLQRITENLGDVTSALGAVFSGVMVAVSAVKNLVLGFIVAAYMLMEKTKMISQCKQIIYFVTGQRLGNALITRLRYSNKVLGGFIRGKLLDSLIIGILCYIGTSLLQMPYPVLLAVIVGITNVIPFFGPFLGAIPCALLVLMHDPIQTLYFVIFILVLQQFDGNILGPKILGDTTGLSSFWVLFSILLFGGLFGFVGMLIGVPLFAVIYSIVSDVVKMGLEKHGLSTDSAAYENLDLVEETEGGYRYNKLKDPTEE